MRICADLKDFGCPSQSWFVRHCLDDNPPGFAKKYARARELQCEAWADRIYIEATTPKIGERTETDATGTVVKVTTGDTVERSRLAVDALKWTLSKIAPKKYGEKLHTEISGADGSPLVIQWHVSAAPALLSAQSQQALPPSMDQRVTDVETRKVE